MNSELPSGLERIVGEVKGESIVRIDSKDQRFREYWENYAHQPVLRAELGNILIHNREAVYLYKTVLSSGEERLNHVLWIYNDLGGGISRYEQLDRRAWDALAHKPEVIGRVNRALVGSYNQVLDFYAWQYHPGGFVVDGTKRFGMESGALAGIHGSYGEILPLMKAVEEGDEEEVTRQQVRLAASVAHEMTHLERDDGLVSQVRTEIASHIAQFIFDPKGNEVFNQQLQDSFAKVEAYSNAKENRDQVVSLDLCDKASYIALLILADNIAGHNQRFRDVLLEDIDPLKLPALRKLQSFITPEDEKYLKSEVLREITLKGNDELLEEFWSIGKRLDVDVSFAEA